MKTAIKIFCASVAVASMSLGPIQVMAANESSSQATVKTTATNTALAVSSVTKHIVKLIGNSETKKFHKPSCELVKKITKGNKVGFASSAEAKKAGYEPCSLCLGEGSAKSSAAGTTVKVEKAAKPQ